MSSRNEGFFNKISAAFFGVPISVGIIMFYKTSYALADFTSDDMIPNLRTVKALISGVNQTIITAGTTLTPLVIAYTTTATPSYTLIRTSDNSFDFNANVQYDGANFTINGADDGSGKFADSYTFNIKP